MTEKIGIEITPNGSIKMLHDDRFDLSAFGPVETRRASFVEYNNSRKTWEVYSAKTGETLASGFDRRCDALTWEKNYFRPGQPGWEEI